jgi:tRNA A37 threonylcarbamoyladenosine dehydratase
VSEFLGQKIHEFLKKDYPKIHWAVDALHSAADLSRSAADKLRDAVIGYLQEVLANPAHP